MSVRRNIPWTRIGAEFVAIVVSILLAFGIQAWWSDRQEHEEIRDMLGAVLDDLQQSQDLVSFRRSVAEARSSSILELLDAAFSGDTQIDGDSIDRLLGDVGWYFSSLPISTGAVSSLIASGKVGDIETNALRRAIADWPRIEEEIRQPLRQEYDVFFESWVPFASDNVYWPQLATVATHFPGNPDVPYPELPLTVTDTVDHSHLLTDRRFQNLLVQTWYTQVDVLGAYDLADEWLSETIQLLQVELMP